jgi:hypothetical protein
VRPVLLAHAASSDEIASTLLFFVAVWVAWVAWSRLRGKGFPKLSRTIALALIPIALVIAVVGAIVPRMLVNAYLRPGATPTVTVPPGPRPASTATLSIERPTPGQRVSGTSLDVVLDLKGGTIVNITTTNIVPNTGHIHLSLDGRLVSMTYGTLQSLDLRGVSPGMHTLTAEFVAADHGPFDPRVIATTTFRKVS